MRSSHTLARHILLRTCITASIALNACGPSPPLPVSPAPPPSDAVVMLLRPGPAAWFADVADRGAGIDYELAQRFRSSADSTSRSFRPQPTRRLNEAEAAQRWGGGTHRRPLRRSAETLHSSSYTSVTGPHLHRD
jgi:hypothetical protein